MTFRITKLADPLIRRSLFKGLRDLQVIDEKIKQEYDCDKNNNAPKRDRSLGGIDDKSADSNVILEGETRRRDKHGANKSNIQSEKSSVKRSKKKAKKHREGRIIVAAARRLANPDFTDLANARKFLLQHGNDLKYCSEWGKWLSWTGNRWAIMSDDKDPLNRAATTVQIMLRDARAVSDSSSVKWAVESHSASRIKAMVSLASTSHRVSVNSSDFDNNQWIINVQNGVIDLRSGELREHTRDLLSTKIAGTSFHPDAICPNWMKFLEFAMNGDWSMVNMLQRIIGYSLTGDISEQVLFFFYGSGRNGKSTFLSVLSSMLGDYCQPAPRGLLESDHNNDHDTRIASLYRARLVLGSEVEAGKHLAEAMIKDLTGGERIAARRMREDYWYFDPTHKIIISGNHKPRVTGTDFGFWRRMKLIPWTRVVKDDEVDPELKDKLMKELPGILNWAVQGCWQWKNDGMGLRTDLVEKATKEYQNEQNELARMPENFKEFCQSNLEFNLSYRLPKQSLWEAYEQWSNLNKKPIVDHKILYKYLREEKHITDTMIRDGDDVVRGWNGVKLKTKIEN